MFGLLGVMLGVQTYKSAIFPDPPKGRFKPSLVPHIIDPSSEAGTTP
jgi:hypothetical protein